MGHKVNPKVFRLGTTTTWPSRWMARDDAYRANLRQDLGIRDFLKKELKDAALNRVDIERSRGTIGITVHTAKPGLVIGRSGEGSDGLKKKILKEFFPGKTKAVQLAVTVLEVSRPSLEATLVVQGVIGDLERRMPFRRVLKMSIERVKKGGALGVKVAVSGRLNGAEIARREWLAWGKIPLTNLRADIDYAADFAQTMTGTVGVKVWIYRGDVFAQDRLNQYQPTTPSRGRGRDGDRSARPAPRAPSNEAASFAPTDKPETAPAA